MTSGSQRVGKVATDAAEQEGQSQLTAYLPRTKDQFVRVGWGSLPKFMASYNVKWGGEDDLDSASSE